MFRRIAFVFPLLMAWGVFSQSLAQQQLPFLRVSPQATVAQNIATFAQVEINYHRPLVNNREVWGQLVPYGLAPNNFGNGKPMPWRAGANETTSISFSHNVKIEGQDLKAGTYGLHMLPSEDDVTVIFNSNAESWGSFFYEKENDLLRVKVKWQDAPHQEALLYAFENLTPNSTTAYLHWGKKKIAFNIKVDRNDTILSEFREKLTNLQGFNQAAYTAAANYCIANDTNLDEAETWLDNALGRFGGQNFLNNETKSRLLALKGKTKEAEELLNTAIGLSTEAELNNYGYILMGATPSRLDEALAIFKKNIERHPDAWNVYDSYAEALNNNGDKKGAIKNYQIALQKAPAAQKAAIEARINAL